MLRAPFDAWVVRRDAEVGQTLVNRGPAKPLVVLAQAGWMMAKARVSQHQVRRLEKGMPIERGERASGDIVNGDG